MEPEDRNGPNFKLNISFQVKLILKNDFDVFQVNSSIRDGRNNFCESNHRLLSLVSRQNHATFSTRIWRLM